MHSSNEGFLDGCVRFGRVPYRSTKLIAAWICRAIPDPEIGESAWKVYKNLIGGEVSAKVVGEVLEIIKNHSGDDVIPQDMGIVLGALSTLRNTLTMTTFDFFGMSLILKVFDNLIKTLKECEIKSLVVASTILDILVVLVSREGWVDWDGILDLYLDLLWIWREGGLSKDHILETEETKEGSVDEDEKTPIWVQSAKILSCITNSFSGLSIASRVSLLTAMVSLPLSSVFTLWLIDSSDSFLFPDAYSFTDHLTLLLDVFYHASKNEDDSLTRTRVFGLLVKSVESGLFEGKTDTILFKIFRSLPLEQYEVVSDVVYTFLQTYALRMKDAQILQLIDALLQTVCAVGVQEGSTLLNFWSFVEENKTVKNIAHPATKFLIYTRLELSDVFRIKAVMALFRLHDLLVGNRKEIAVVVYSWMCRIASWNAVASGPIRLLALEFVGGFTWNGHQVMYKREGDLVVAPFMALLNVEGRIRLPIECYLFSIIAILRFEPCYEVLQTALDNVKNQLANQDMWSSCNQIKMLTDTIVSMISLDFNFGDLLDLPAAVKKHDLFLGLYQILLALFIYKSALSKKQQDALVPALVFGLGRWPPIARYCVQGLALALFEIPSSIIKHLTAILLKISQVTSSALALPNLEFLASLAFMPALLVNFTTDDYKRVFGIALTYLRQRGGASAQQPTFAYYVAQVWFLALKMQERKVYVPMIVQTLLANSEKSTEELDESVELVLCGVNS